MIEVEQSHADKQESIHRNREPTKSKNAHPTVAQIEDMHF
jgi:hypothetical protein